MNGGIGTCAVLAFAIAALAITTTRSSIFEPMRDWLMERNLLLHKLLTCPYCFSHWLALAAMLLYRPRLVASAIFAADAFATWAALVGASALVVYLILALSSIEASK